MDGRMAATVLSGGKSQRLSRLTRCRNARQAQCEHCACEDHSLCRRSSRTRNGSRTHPLGGAGLVLSLANLLGFTPGMLRALGHY